MLLEVNQLTREYKRGREAFRAVDEVSFTMADGEFVSIRGRSGSGKSTLLNLITGLLQPTGGSVFLDGENIFELDDRNYSYLRNSKLGYVSQVQSALSNLTVMDNVRLPFFLSKRDGEPSERAAALLEQVGIAHLAKAYPAQLSGGELKRVAIARALILSPELLIADEPTCDLDLQTTKEVLEFLASVAQRGTAVLMVTHEADASEYCNRTLFMESGKLVHIASGNPSGIFCSAI
ncbi:MAG: transporter ATP-binding protein [Bacillota bacterium]|nr:transporter ATP-binding protein [Bacillota bacterium]